MKCERLLLCKESSYCVGVGVHVWEVGGRSSAHTSPWQIAVPRSALPGRGPDEGGSGKQYRATCHPVRRTNAFTEARGRLNIKMLSYQYRDSHVKDKTVSPTVLSLTWDIPIPGKDGLYIETGPRLHRVGSFSLHWLYIWYTRMLYAF